MFGPLLSLDESFRCSSSVSLVVDHHSPCPFVPCPLSRQVEIPHCGESHSGLSHVLRNAGCQRLSWAPWLASGVLGQVDVHGFAGGCVGGHSQDVSCHSPPSLFNQGGCWAGFTTFIQAFIADFVLQLDTQDVSKLLSVEYVNLGEVSCRQSPCLTVV